jgi:hypothetical protein
VTACGSIPISRLAGGSPQLPNSQGYIGTGGSEFRPLPVFTVPGPPLNTAPMPPGIGAQCAPGQGGDTPGGGGASMIGEPVAVQCAWFQDGYVITPSRIHVPGTVGYRGARRGGA